MAVQSVSPPQTRHINDFCCNLSPRVYHRLLKPESTNDDRTLMDYQRFHVKRARDKMVMRSNSERKSGEFNTFSERKHVGLTSNRNLEDTATRKTLAPLTVPSIRLETSCGSTVSCSPSISDSELSSDTLDDAAFFQTPAISGSVSPPPEVETVVLPGRYRRRALESDSDESSSPTEVENNDLGSREKDLGVALKWIRQEILEMKAQDRSLLKQFIELRASILQLRNLYDVHSSCSDVSSLDGSTYSLNEQAKSPRMRRLVVDHDDIKPCLSLPNSPRVARFKWKSDEYI